MKKFIKRFQLVVNYSFTVLKVAMSTCKPSGLGAELEPGCARNRGRMGFTTIDELWETCNSSFGEEKEGEVVESSE